MLRALTGIGDDEGVLAPAAAERLRQVGTSRVCRADEVLHWAGAEPASAYLVDSGRLRFRQFDVEGRERIMGWAKPGMMACLAYAVAGKPSGLDFVADQCSVVVAVPRQRLLQLMREEPQVGLAIAVVLSERMVETVETYMTQSYDLLADKVWSCLERLARHAGTDSGGSSRELQVTQEVLASAVGASRYRVGLELQQLAARELIVRTRGRIRLLRRA